MTYSKETELLMVRCKEQGFNLWPMLAIFKRRSQLKPNIPDEVVQNVCKEYLGRMRELRANFPYFLKVLENKSREYFAKENIKEHQRIKKEPMCFKDIMKEICKDGNKQG